MSLLEEYIAREVEELREQGVRVRVLGDLERLTPAAARAVERVTRETDVNTRLTLNLFISYGGRAELVRASALLAEDVAAGKLAPADIDDAAIAQRLYTADCPDPDLLIRTSGELRVSNFLLWQIAYAELLHLAGAVARLRAARALRGDHLATRPATGASDASPSERLAPAPGDAPVSELAKRVASALVGAPIAIACIWFGDAALATLLAIIAGTGAWELYRMARAAGTLPFARTGIVLAAIVPLVVHAHVLQVGTPPLTVGVLIVLALLALSIWRRGVEGRPLVSVAVTLLGVLYVGVPISYGYALRYFDWAVGRAAGAAVLLLPVLCTWASDIGAYAAGRLIGGRKLIPSVSPGKTISGSVGGLVASAALAAAYGPLVLRPVAQLGFAPGLALAFGVVVSVAAQLGDLVESLLKRDAGVKDSSQLIPGHGGVLDRMDSLLFVLPVSYLLLQVMLLPAYGRS